MERTVQYDEDLAYAPQPDLAELPPAEEAGTPAGEMRSASRVRRQSTPLRRELNHRNQQRATSFEHETTYGSSPCTIYRPQPDGTHGNFFPASYRRILANPAWAARLRKAYTASGRIAHSRWRQRAELDCANSSDALLMNIFCHPSLTRWSRLHALLGLAPAKPPCFGVRAHTPLRNGHHDRTEIDMVLHNSTDKLLVEAKLSEVDFQTARPALLDRYPTLCSTFDVEALTTRDGHFQAYQLLRSVLAAHHHQARFAVMLDARRTDLLQDIFQVYSAVRSTTLRSRLHVITWQEIAACVPQTLQTFLAGKYGVEAAQ